VGLTILCEIFRTTILGSVDRRFSILLEVHDSPLKLGPSLRLHWVKLTVIPHGSKGHFTHETESP
jgi:hypothetical protein